MLRLENLGLEVDATIVGQRSYHPSQKLCMNNGTEELTNKLKAFSDPYYISIPLRDREVGKTQVLTMTIIKFIEESMKYIESQDLGSCQGFFSLRCSF